MTLAYSVLIVEDDDELRAVLGRGLREEGFTVDSVSTGSAVLERVEGERPDVVVIDVGLPDADGRDVCQALRARGIDTPVLFLTARDALVDRIAGFDAGGDDYLSKPFAFVELVARMHALLRRAGAEPAIEAAGLRLDPARHSVSSESAERSLTPTEFRLLARLLARPGEAVRRRELFARAGHTVQSSVKTRSMSTSLGCVGNSKARRRTGHLDGAQRWLSGRMSRLGLRLRLLLAVLASVGVALAGLVAIFNVILDTTLNGNARDLARSRAIAETASLRFDHGKLAAGEAPDNKNADAYLWIFAGGRVVQRPHTPAVLDNAARGLTGRAPGFVDVASTDTRLYATSVEVRGRRLGTVVAGVSLVPYEQTRATALAGSLVFGGAALVLVALASRWLLASSLRPVVRMTRQTAAWSERDLDHRFALGRPHDELTELAATLDGLLDRLAASLRHERRFSAELSHELRTPLSRIVAETELALRRPREPDEYRRSLELVGASAAQLSRIIDALVTAARYEAGGRRATADAVEVAAGAAAACEALVAERRIELEVANSPAQVRVGVDADLAERILQPVIENACRYGTTRVRVAIVRDDAGVAYSIEDDGPGVAELEREWIFEPGARGAVANGRDGAGLGLALARRLARSVDGDVTADAHVAGGRFVVRLPSG